MRREAAAGVLQVFLDCNFVFLEEALERVMCLKKLDILESIQVLWMLGECRDRFRYQHNYKWRGRLLLTLPSFVSSTGVEFDLEIMVSRVQ